VAVGPLPTIRRRKLRISQAFADPPRLIGDLTLAELLQGFARDTDYRTARKLLLELPCVSAWSAESSLVHMALQTLHQSLEGDPAAWTVAQVRGSG
jgi:hypothetical protein